LDSQQSNESFVDEVVSSMKYFLNTTLILEGDVSLDHVISHPIQQVDEELVMSMKYLVDPTLILESYESTNVVSLMQYFANTSPLLWSDASFNYAFIISSLVHYEEGGIPLS
jgi:hypothetical protein